MGIGCAVLQLSLSASIGALKWQRGAAGQACRAASTPPVISMHAEAKRIRLVSAIVFCSRTSGVLLPFSRRWMPAPRTGKNDERNRLCEQRRRWLADFQLHASLPYCGGSSVAESRCRFQAVQVYRILTRRTWQTDSLHLPFDSVGIWEIEQIFKRTAWKAVYNSVVVTEGTIRCYIARSSYRTKYVRLIGKTRRKLLDSQDTEDLVFSKMIIC